MLSTDGKYQLIRPITVVIVEKKSNNKYSSLSEKLTLNPDEYSITDIKELKFKNKPGMVFHFNIFDFWIQKPYAEYFYEIKPFSIGDIVKVQNGVYENRIGVIKSIESDKDIRVYINSVGLLSFESKTLQKAEEKVDQQEVEVGDEVIFKGNKKGIVVEINDFYLTVDCDTIQYKIKPYYIIEVRKLTKNEKQAEVEKRKNIIKLKRLRQQAVKNKLSNLVPSSMNAYIGKLCQNISNFIKALKDKKIDVISMGTIQNLEAQSVLMRQLYNTADKMVNDQLKLFSYEHDDYDPLKYKDMILKKENEISRVIEKLGEIFKELPDELQIGGED